MVVTFETCENHIRHTLSGAPDLPIKALISEAGNYFTTHHPWLWLVGRSAQLDYEAPVSFSGWDWTEATLTLDDPATGGELDDYNFNEGDQVEITAGVGTKFPKTFNVASNPDGDTLILKSSITTTAGDLVAADIDGNIQKDYLVLPSDFHEVTAIDATDSLIREFYQTSLEHLLELRTNPIEVTTWYWWAAISHTRVPGAVVPVFEIWPGPNATEFGAITLFYRAKWAEIDDGDIATLPDYCETYFLNILRAFARGYIEEDTGNLDGRLGKLYAGEICRAARRADGSRNSGRYLGPITNGAIQMVSHPEQTPFARTPVAHPS